MKEISIQNYRVKRENEKLTVEVEEVYTKNAKLENALLRLKDEKQSMGSEIEQLRFEIGELRSKNNII